MKEQEVLAAAIFIMMVIFGADLLTKARHAPFIYTLF